jgi:hypothetical protein
MARYHDLKNDLPFKRIFGDPDLLKSFLNVLMPFKAHRQIETLEYLPSEQVPENPAKKNSIVNVRWSVFQMVAFLKYQENRSRAGISCGNVWKRISA